MRTIDRIIDCFMQSLSDCLLVHLGSSLLSMHYSELTTIQRRRQYHLKNECQQEYNSRLESHQTLLFCTENTKRRELFHIFLNNYVSGTQCQKSLLLLNLLPKLWLYSPYNSFLAYQKMIVMWFRGFPTDIEVNHNTKISPSSFLVTETQKKPL